MGAVLLLCKLFLAHSQQVFLWPDEAVLDDMVMYNAAVSITKGHWLGAYSFTVLAKNSFFALWLAFLHKLGIPFLLGGQLLWAAASGVAAFSVHPVLKRRWLGLFLYAVLLFSPSSTANPAPYGFVTRVYRDNIFPALCLLCIGGMVGFALRLFNSPQKNVWWLGLSGLSFGAAWLCREDGWWLVFFVLGGALTCGFFLVKAGLGKGQKSGRLATLLLPFAICGLCLFGWSAANKAAYGRFVINDFTSGEFADAYGAITRIQHQNWQAKVAVPKDVRTQLYLHVPEFAKLKPILEGDVFLEKYAGKNKDGSFKDYSSGAFYWALRHAAAELGHYDSPEKARLYWQKMANDINALCNNGTIAAGAKRSSVSPPLKAQYIAPVLKEAFYSLWFCASFVDCQPQSLFSPGGNDPAFYAQTLKPMEDFLRQKALTATRENSTLPYYSKWQSLAYWVFSAKRVFYAAVLPPAFLAALFWQLQAGFYLFCKKGKNAKGKPAKETILWVLMLGLFLCIFLRACMIAFVTVSSFNIGTFVMYLASVHPLMLLYAFIGVFLLFGNLQTKKRGHGI